MNIFNFLSQNLTNDDNFVRNFLDLNLVMTVGTENINTYMKVNEPINGIVQQRPQFTNINNGNFNFIPVNTENLPNPVTLIGPADETVLTIDGDNADGQTGIFWTSSTDPDTTPVEYILELIVENTGDTLDTVLTNSNIFFEHQEFLDYMVDSEVTHLDIVWDVYNFNGFEGIESSNGPWSLTIDGGWALDVDNSTVPEVFALHNNYPNPFNPVTNIKYDIYHSKNLGGPFALIDSTFYPDTNYYHSNSNANISQSFYYLLGSVTCGTNIGAGSDSLLYSDTLSTILITLSSVTLKPLINFV
mgnify:CR=1 FL=1